MIFMGSEQAVSRGRRSCAELCVVIDSTYLPHAFAFDSDFSHSTCGFQGNRTSRPAVLMFPDLCRAELNALERG